MVYWKPLKSGERVKERALDGDFSIRPLREQPASTRPKTQ